MATTLEDLIDQQINLGYKDPHQIPDLLERQLGDDLFNVVKPYIADFIAEMSRHRIGNLRRKSVARITKSGLQDPEILLRSMWVPDPEHKSIVYKRIADLTPDDFDARAAYLDHMADGITRSAEWCRDCANAIRSANVETAGQLDHLPPLPE